MDSERPLRPPTSDPRASATSSEAAAGKRAALWPWALLALCAAGVGAWFALGSGAAEGKAGSGPGGAGGGPKATPVSTAVVARGPFTAHATFPGELAADAAQVGALVPGRLAAVHVRLGDRVEAGQLLAEIDPGELTEQLDEARAQVKAAEAAGRKAAVEVRAAERELSRTRELLAREVASRQDTDARVADAEARRAAVAAARAQEGQVRARVALLERRLAEARVVAPFAGVVAERHLDPGGYVTVGAPIVRLVARAPLRVSFEVPEGELAALKLEAPFRVRAAPTGAREWAGRVTGSGGEVVRDRRIVRVEGVIDEPPAEWLAGMFAEVVSVRGAYEDVAIVPDAALVSRLDAAGTVKTGLFLPEGAKARWVAVEVLAREDGRAAVASELAAGAAVLVGGHSELEDGAAILIAGAKKGEGPGKPVPEPSAAAGASDRAGAR